MRLGVIARAEDRGLGVQSWEACRHLNPDRVLLIDPPGNHPRHVERFDPWPVTEVRWHGGPLDEPTVRRWLEGLDAIYTAETFYDQRMPSWARAAGCEPFCHVNPEFFAWRKVEANWWAPSPWRIDAIPTARLVPMPVATDRLRPTDHHGPPMVLHVAGHAAAQDRNGTRTVLAANLPNLTVTDQATGNVPNYWDLYAGFDILVMPRRYGGLCLPVQEAMACGLVVVMSDIEPNRYWPGPRVPVRKWRTLRTAGGAIPVYDCDPTVLHDVVTELVNDPVLLARERAQSLAWAEANSWDALRPVWLEELAGCGARL